MLTTPRKPAAPIPADASLVDIDLHRLIEEWARQAPTYRQEADKLTELERAHDAAKLAVEIAEEELKEVAASVLLAAKLNPDRAGLGANPTVGVLDAFVTTSAQVRTQRRAIWEAMRHRDEARATAGYQKNIVRALEHRKEALQDAVKLTLNDLGAEPRAPRGAGELARDMNRDAAFGHRSNRNKDQG